MQKSINCKQGYTIHKNPTFGEPFFKVFYDMLQLHLNMNVTVATSKSFFLFIYPLFSPSTFFSLTPKFSHVWVIVVRFRSSFQVVILDLGGSHSYFWLGWIVSIGVVGFGFGGYHGQGGLLVYVVATVIIENNIMNIFYINLRTLLFI